jgi:hypothetical protein
MIITQLLNLWTEGSSLYSVGQRYYKCGIEAVTVRGTELGLNGDIEG